MNSRRDSKARMLRSRLRYLVVSVNGPGEASEADIGIAGGGGKGILYRNGEQVRIVPESEMVNALYEEVQAWKREQAGQATVEA